MTNFTPDNVPHGNPSFQLNQVARLVTRYFDRGLAPLGVNVAYLSVLGALKESKHLSQKELAEIGRIGQPAMAQMLERMVKEGLLVRAQDRVDRRKVLFALSQRALELMPRVEAKLVKGNAEIFSSLGSEGLTTLLQQLQKLEAHISSELESNLN